MRLQIAMTKAWVAIGHGISSRKLGEMGEEMPIIMDTLINITDQ